MGILSFEEAIKIPRPRAPIPFFVPSLGEEEEAEVVATLRSGWLTSGARVQRFEEELRKFLGTEREICAVSSCTAALFLSLVSAGVQPGDSVLVPAFTFVSTVNVILHLGAHPVFCDIHPETLNIDVDQIPPKIHPGIKILLPVHFGGYPADLERIYSL
ncbi:MAG: aminotransferase class I/II-fold pyridoxal phosphate-dependent enzyme, partial [bacterium]